MRGKAYHPHLHLLLCGITPAYAGKSELLIVHCQQLWDHPRVCGEKSAVSGCCAATSGSPPRMRGKVLRPAAFSPEEGITPAYAGKSDARSNRRRVRRDHPRVCGEKSSTSPMKCLKLGSPPRMRGKVLLYCYSLSQVGITPAYAGKSPRATASRATPWDHPRVCGEKLGLAQIPGSVLGSPPRMRGKDDRRRMSAGKQGITPAYAGKSYNEKVNGAGNRDHPRVCGEKCGLPSHTFSVSGSPPRMRGKVFLKALCEGTLGITPAYAGKSVPQSSL